MESRENQLVIGITGPLGAGVSTVAEAIAACKTPGSTPRRVRISDSIKSELRRRHKLEENADIKVIPNWRKELQDIGNEGRENKLSHWVELALADVHDCEIIIDGIRNPGEIAYLRERFPRFFLVAVLAPRDVRWSRCKDEYEHNEKTFFRDEERDSREEIEFGQHVGKCTQEADYVLVNVQESGARAGIAKKLRERLLEDVQLMRHFDARPTERESEMRMTPTPMEAHMATAYAQSRMSHCIKRYVGAIIVNQRNIPLSIGYNENPGTMRPCYSQFNKCCFKDEIVEAKLEEMHDVYCPRCGHSHQSLSKPWKCLNKECNASFKSTLFPSRGIEVCTAIHAEERAIHSLAGRTADGATIYTTTFPCFQCSRLIVEAGIKDVVYVEAYPISEAIQFLKLNEVRLTPFAGFKGPAFSMVFRQAD